MGYRYYDKAEKAVRFPFGHGLSYTTFEYSDLEIKNDAVSVTVTNTGAYPGAEVAGEAVPAPGWQTGSWYETMAGAPSRSGWERVMGRTVPITPELKKGQFTLDSTCMEMKDSSLVMKIQYKVTEGIIAKGFGGKKDYSDPAFKMMMVCATDCPMRAAAISAGGSMTDGLAQGLVEMANGHFIRGIRAMLKK